MTRVPTILALTAASFTAMAAQAAGGPPIGTFDVTFHNRNCLVGRCQNDAASGRLVILTGGRILNYLGAAGGVRYQLGRTVDLSGRGRLPTTINGLVPQSGRGTARFDGRRLTLITELTGTMQQNGGYGTLSIRYNTVFEFDPASGSLVGGTNSASGSVQGQNASGQPFSGPASVSGTITPR